MISFYPLHAQKNSGDDLDEILSDIEGDEFILDEGEESDFFQDLPAKKDTQKQLPVKSAAPRMEKSQTPPQTTPQTPLEISGFEPGKEEKELLMFVEKIGNKLSHNEWTEIAKTTSHHNYTILKDDTLWGISKTLFGTGFYYSKIWALNSYITNPHLIEPGMVLTFTSGSDDSLPEIKVGKFLPEAQEDSSGEEGSLDGVDLVDGYDKNLLSRFTDGDQSPWLKQRQQLINQGYYVENISDFTYEDLKYSNQLNLVTEYKNYEPPLRQFNVESPRTFDEVGFDKSSIKKRRVSSGFYLRTFITSNTVQDLGYIEAGQRSSSIFTYFDIAYLRLDEKLNVVAGDQFSVYERGGVVGEYGDREGYRYFIKGHVKVLGRKNDLWECKVTDMMGSINRKDRITVFTPKIEKILTTYSQRKIEAIIIASFNEGKLLLSYGDVVYLDRGRADGLEIGNVLNVYSFKDRSTGRTITEDPTYRVGELTVISLSDDFSTVLISSTNYELQLGQLAITKTLEEAIREKDRRQGAKDAKKMEQKALDELDVELNLGDVGEKLLEEAKKIELTDDEIDELERKERAKSFIKEHQSDQEALDRIEEEVEEAQTLLDEESVDQNRLLEQHDLDKLEETIEKPAPDAFESIDEIEKEVGKKYMDEELNSKENPYGLTEFDLEDLDELLGTIPDKDKNDGAESQENINLLEREEKEREDEEEDGKEESSEEEDGKEESSEEEGYQEEGYQEEGYQEEGYQEEGRQEKDDKEESRQEKDS